MSASRTKESPFARKGKEDQLTRFSGSGTVGGAGQPSAFQGSKGSKVNWDSPAIRNALAKRAARAPPLAHQRRVKQAGSEEAEQRHWSKR